MQFSAGRPDMIRAINQRWLINFWTRNLGNQAVPRWQSVEAEDLSRVSSDLSFMDVVTDRDVVRFLIRFHGATIGRVYGSPDCRGKFLDDIIPMDRHGEGLAPYRQTIQSGCPVYTIHDVTDRQGRLVHCERLLLPFASDGKTVDRVLASFEFICADGAFDSQKLMIDLSAPPTLRLSATIKRQAMA